MVADIYIHTCATTCWTCFPIWSHVIRPAPIFVWVLINTDVVVITTGAYILRCIFCMGVYYLNFAMLLYMHYEQNISM